MIKSPELCNIHQDTLFVRFLTRLFRALGSRIAKNPLLWLSLSTFLTLLCVARIPFTPLANDVSDFTPSGARARLELQQYKDFFSNGGEPLAMYLFVTAKDNNSMLGIRQLEETVRLLNIVSEKIPMQNPVTGENLTFNQFCTNFCTINEPVRHFYNGLLVGNNFDNSTEHIDLGYPVTTVLGRQLHMDPNFFGVKIAIKVGNATKIVSINKLRVASGRSLLSSASDQVRNNIKEIKLIGLQFRAELPNVFKHGASEQWEDKVIRFARKEFKSDYVDVLVISETFLTKEVVRSGLTLIPFLVIGFVIMCIFSSITMSLSALYMNQFGAHNVLLAVMACVCPFMAVGTSLGGMFWVGFRFGSILCVTPFLVLAIGVDDAYLMVNAWQNIRKRLDSECNRKLRTKSELLEHLLVETMVDTGPSISITTITNLLAFVIGIFTPTPEIQLFSIGNAIAIVIDYVYQWTVFGSFMVLTGYWKLNEVDTAPSESDSAQKIVKLGEKIWVVRPCVKEFNSSLRKISDRFLGLYCQMLSNKLTASLVMIALAGYIYTSIYGVLEMRSELRPEQLFIHDSDVIKVLELRNKYIIPFYAVCLVFVNKPGNFSDIKNVQRLSAMVADFENLPSSLGSFATKYFVRDYEEFIRSADESSRLFLDEFAEPNEEVLGERNKNELKQFLEWPEFQFWNGFIRLEPDPVNLDNFILKRFFFTIAAHGSELKDWSKRAQLLQEWRNVADSYPEYEVSIYEDDAKFLDLIPTMIPQTIQSAFCTLICMFLVCLLFIRQTTAVIIANFSIFSTCVGVFGILSLMGVELDPIVLSSCIMSIGFSVDIPGHITYHFIKFGADEKARLSVTERLHKCLGSIGFPILEAGFSTIICVTSLTFIELHMAQVFAKTMILVVALSLVHGLLIIPVMLYLMSLIPFNQPFVLNTSSEIIAEAADQKLHAADIPIKPMCLQVNLKM